MVYTVTDHGVVPNRESVQTRNIQQVLDICAESGGGIVRFSAGVYLTGTLTLRSDTTIEIDPGAVIRGSTNLSDYPSFGLRSENRDTALFVARGERNIGFRGGGQIDGNGDAFFDLSCGTTPRDYDPERTRQGAAYAERPDGATMGPVQYLKADGHQARPGTLMLLIDCEQVRVDGISIVGSPNWCLHLAGCRYALLTGLFIRNSMLIPNADCIDVANSSYVTISDCVLEAGDDGIAISPCADGYHMASTEHINVSNCMISSRSAGIRVGYGIERVRDVHFSNIHIYASNRGIGVFVRNGQVVENVTFTNVTIETRLFSGWWGAGEPIHISATRGYADDGTLGHIRNVRFQNVTATGEAGIVLFSDDHDDGECHIHDIAFEHVRFKVVRSPLEERYGGNIDLRPAIDPARQIFSADLGAILAKNVDGLDLVDVDIRLADGLPEYRFRGLAANGTRRIHRDRFRAYNADGTEAAVEVEEVDAERLSSTVRKITEE